MIDAGVRSAVVAKLEEAIKLVQSDLPFSLVEDMRYDRVEDGTGTKYIPRSCVVSFSCMDPAKPENLIKVTIDTSLGEKND